MKEKEKGKDITRMGRWVVCDVERLGYILPSPHYAITGTTYV
jgi:hypothetical protein